MYVINASSIAAAYASAIKYILKNGYDVVTEDNDVTKESEPIAIKIDSPLDGKLVHGLSPFKEQFLEAYANDILYGNANATFEYDYHSRLFEWKGIVNQIEYIICKLKSNPTSRRAIAITWEPDVDNLRDDVPCLQLVQFSIRDDKLNMTVVFRSNDMLLACGANMYGLAMLQKYVLDKLNSCSDKNYKIGTYEHISLIPHIYVNRDADIVQKHMELL